MAPSVPKLLIHGAEKISSVLLPVGQLTEEARKISQIIVNIIPEHAVENNQTKSFVTCFEFESNIDK